MKQNRNGYKPSKKIFADLFVYSGAAFELSVGGSAETLGLIFRSGSDIVSKATVFISQSVYPTYHNPMSGAAAASAPGTHPARFGDSQ